MLTSHGFIGFTEGAMTTPDPVAAATAPEPAAAYAALRAQPLARHDGLGLWIAARAAAVAAVLTDERCRVRPLAEPVPSALIGSPAGEIFGRLVRMNDGARQAPLKAHVTAMLEALAPPRVAAIAAATAHTLAGELGPHAGGRALDTFMWRLAPSVVGTLLGVTAARIPEVVDATADFVAAIAPAATADAVARGAAAAGRLLDLGRALADGEGLVAALVRQASDADAAIANALGFLSQSYDATAGLVGNTLVALARQPELRGADVRAVVTEVARHDAPVQNTRRFVAEDTVIEGQAVKAGDAILVVLAAANRDPAANPDPDRFRLDRASPRIFTFGLGAHACPGAILATTVAAAGVTEVVKRGLALDGLAAGVRYRPSPNTRVPVFAR
jgi:cytochrome P450